MTRSKKEKTESHPTYSKFIALAVEVYGRKLPYIVIPKLAFKFGSLFNKQLKELQELLPRYEHHNVFDDTKFKQRFPGFQITTCRQGIELIREEQPSVVLLLYIRPVPFQ